MLSNSKYLYKLVIKKREREKKFTPRRGYLKLDNQIVLSIYVNLCC